MVGLWVGPRRLCTAPGCVLGRWLDFELADGLVYMIFIITSCNYKLPKTYLSLKIMSQKGTRRFMFVVWLHACWPAPREPHFHLRDGLECSQ